MSKPLEAIHAAAARAQARIGALHMQRRLLLRQLREVKRRLAMEYAKADALEETAPLVEANTPKPNGAAEPPAPTPPAPENPS